MGTMSAALPVERSYLLKAWLVVVGIVVVAAMTIALGLSTVGARPAGGTDPPPAAGSTSVARGSIWVNGSVCGQCR